MSIATASYRILPLIILNPAKPVPTHLATKFQNCFAPGVIKLDPHTKQVSVDEKNLRRDTVSREVLRHPEFEGCVELKRVRDFFLCKSCTAHLAVWHYPLITYLSTVNIESESFYPPERLLPEAIKVMRDKIATIRKAAEALLADSDASDGDVVNSRGGGAVSASRVGEEDDIVMTDA